MKTSELISRLEQLVAKYGDADFVCVDMDTGHYLEMNPSNVAPHRLGAMVWISALPENGYSSDAIDLRSVRAWNDGVEIIRD